MRIRLVLLDIDGTLLWPDGAGRAAMKAAMEHVYGTAGPIDKHGFSGFTDRHNVRVLLQETHLSQQTIDQGFSAFVAHMASEMRTRIARGDHDVRPCPGAHALVNRLQAHKDVVLGLVTGNFRETAFIKLEAAGFNPAIFRVGAFGDMSENRADLPPAAMRQARALVSEDLFPVIIGDTEHDVTCGGSVGARSIAVLTGFSTREIIEAHAPDYIFEDLSNTQAVLAAILA